MKITTNPRRIAAGSALVLAVGAPMLTAAPAHAARPIPAAAGCADSAAGAARTTGHTRPDDGMGVSRQVAAQVNRQLTAPGNLRAAQRLPDGSIQIPVVAHIIRGTKKKKRLKRAQLDAQMTVLNQAYSGVTAPGVASNTSFRFVLVKVKRTHNNRWFNLPVGPRGETKVGREMKKKLHKGGRSTLNLYFVKLSHGLLGYSTFPWNAAAHPKLDGVVIDYRTAFGNRAPFAEGDTGTHEIGHWLGLLHTFEGGASGCGADPNASGDFVADTASESEPTIGCPAANTSCAGSLGTVHNFMDYAYDACMNMFTAGQAERMSAAWIAFRA